MFLLRSPVVVSTLGEVAKQGIATWELRGADSTETLGLLFHYRLALLRVDRDLYFGNLAIVLLLVEWFPAQRLVFLAQSALELLVLAG